MSRNGWVTPVQVSVIAGKHKSILGRDLMGTLGLELVQRVLVMGIGITVEDNSDSAERLDEVQTYLCKMYLIFFTQIEKIRNAKDRAEFSSH